MFNWKVTATTVFCEDVGDEVTLIVMQDGSARCTARDKYTKPDKETADKLKRRSRQVRHRMACKGSACTRPMEYRDKLRNEETPKT